MKKRILSMAILIVLCLGLASCLSRSISYFEDHPTRGLTKMETTDVTNYFIFPPKIIYTFWTCKDNGKKMVCKKQCDGKNDLKCPRLL